MKSLTHNDLGKVFLVEECQKVSISNYLKQAKDSLRKVILESILEHQNIAVRITSSKVHRNGVRYWFVCPVCNNRVGVLFIHPLTQTLGCRTCLGLKYKKSQFKGMVEM